MLHLHYSLLIIHCSFLIMYLVVVAFHYSVSEQFFAGFFYMFCGLVF